MSAFTGHGQFYIEVIKLKTSRIKSSIVYSVRIFEKYKQRQMIIEYPFGTIKLTWDAGFFLTRGKESVTAKVALSYLTCNFKRAIKVLGVEEMDKWLKEGRKPALV